MEKNILQNRRYTRWFHQERYPEKELIEQLLERTFKLVPSKQNMIPYSITVFGPEYREVKEMIIELSTRDYHKKGGNPNKQLKAPYLLIFTNRLITNPNKYVQTLIKKGHEFKVCLEDKFNRSSVKIETSLEIGMFSMILTTLALEHGIDTAYTLCQFNNPANQTIVENEVLFIMSLGYRASEYGVKEFKKQKILQGEIKPNIEDIINWK